MSEADNGSQAHPLKVERVRMGLTQKQLAERAEVAVRTVGTIESQLEGYRPRPHICRRLAWALGYKTDRWRQLFPEWWGVEIDE